MTLMQDNAAYLGDRIQQYGGRPVTYFRSPVKKFPNISAAPREKEYKGDQRDGVFTQVRMVDWLVLQVQPVTDDVTQEQSDAFAALEPRVGDTITDADGKVYDVLPVGDKPPWDWEDNAEVTLVIHTKRVK